ncbi:MAG: hypothetical protein PHV68_00685 [Candidatus Gastranaerophilales bacterium]|nr:hypothetical protein [Candidatus Gastranaerophilales bacterium]
MKKIYKLIIYFLLINTIFVQADNIIVENIEIIHNPIFDTEKVKKFKSITKLGNKLHFNTKKSVILKTLLFKKGESVDDEKIKESERKLRSLKFIGEAEITKELIKDNKYNLKIKIRDQWTTLIGGSIKSQGGNNSAQIRIKEDNLFGYGKSIKVKNKLWGSGDSTAFFQLDYFDPYFLNSELNLKLHLIDQTKQKNESIYIGLPFISQNSKFSWYAQMNRDYYNEHSAEERNLKLDFKYAIGKPYNKLFYRAGYDYIKEKNSTTTYHYLIRLGIGKEKLKYIKQKYLRKSGLIEDVKLGYETFIDVIWFIPKPTNELSGNGISAKFDYGKKKNNNFMFLNLNAQYNYYKTAKEFFYDFQIQNYYKFNKRFLSIFQSRYRQIHDDKDYNSLNLGFKTGLRGYTDDAFSGKKIFINNFELRYFFEKPWFQFIKPAIGLFFDIGSVDSKKDNLNLSDFKFDIGFNFQWHLYKLSDHEVIHFNFAVSDKADFLFTVGNSINF